MDCLVGFIGKDDPTIPCSCMLFTEICAFQNLDKKVEEVRLCDVAPFYFHSSVQFILASHFAIRNCQLVSLRNKLKQLVPVFYVTEI